jgi:xylan 1,4-beta-xylosidase
MPDGHVRMNVANQLRAIANGFAIVASFPELKGKPVVIGESDPEGCAACDSRTTPSNAYRNGTMYSSYTAEQLARTYELADKYGVNLLGAVTWAFEFEGQPWFDGFRDLATNGVNKPVFNVFEMLGHMRGDRVAVTTSGGLSLDSVTAASVRGHADVNALAARDDKSISVLVWNYHDDDLPAAGADVELTITGVPARRATVTQTQVDHDHGNSYEKWKALGSPEAPTASEISELERASVLQPLGPPASHDIGAGRLVLRFPLPRQAVSLLRITW